MPHIYKYFYNVHNVNIFNEDLYILRYRVEWVKGHVDRFTPCMFSDY